MSRTISTFAQSATLIPCSSSTSLVDHKLASFPERISQKSIINVGFSDHPPISLGKLVELKLEVCAKNKSSDLRIVRFLLIKTLCGK